MAEAQNIRLGPRAKFTFNGVPTNYVSGTVTKTFVKFSLNDDTNPNADKSITGRYVYNVNVTTMADVTQIPSSALGLGRNGDGSGDRYASLLIEPYGAGEGGSIFMEKDEDAGEGFLPTTVPDFRMDPGQGGPIMVNIVGESSGEVVDN